MAASLKLITGKGLLGSRRSFRSSPPQRGRPMHAPALRMQAKASSSTDPQTTTASSSSTSYSPSPSSPGSAAASASRPRSSSSIPSSLSNSVSSASADTKTMRAIPSPYHPVDTSSYDLNLSHYKIPLLRFLSPPVVIGTGIIFIIAANLMEGRGEFSLAVTAEAAVPVVMWWFVLLHVLPGAFRRFAQQYMETHEFVPATSTGDQQQGQQNAASSNTHEKE